MTDLASTENRPSIASRNSYLDLLCVVALAGAVAYLWFGWKWTAIVIPFPAIGFALAGSAMAAALERSPASPWVVLARRSLGVLLPVWGLAAVAIPLMMRHGSGAGIEPPLDWQTLWLWVVPIFEPPTDASGTAWTGSLWFVPAYLWLTMLSRPLLWSFRRWPLRTLSLPVVGLVLACSGVWDPSGGIGEVMVNLAIFSGLWLIGFAYQDGRIGRMPLTRVILVPAALMTGGLLATGSADAITAAHLAGLPLASSIWGAGAVILLLRLGHTAGSWVPPSWMSTALIACRNCAVTIFLWSFPAFSISSQLTAAYGDLSPGIPARLGQIGLALAVLLLPVVLLGWLETIGRGHVTSPPERQGRGRQRAAPLAGPLVASGAVTAIVVTALVVPTGSAPLVPGPRAAVPASPPTTSTGASDADLPPRVVAGYWQSWGDPSVRLRDVPAAYNLIFAAFAIGDASGKVTFSQSVQSKSSFIRDVDALNRSGRPVLLSVGGWDDGGLTVRTDTQRRALVRSLSKIIDSYHFQGIDWDLEHGIDPTQIAQATHDLTERYGSDFVITMAPLLDKEREGEQLELAVRITDVLDLASPQFYNHGDVDSSWIVSRTLGWGQVVGQHKVAMGFMTVNTPTDTGEQSPRDVCMIWEQLRAQAPAARGLSTWSINLDKRSGYDFARSCARGVRD